MQGDCKYTLPTFVTLLLLMLSVQRGDTENYLDIVDDRDLEACPTTCEAGNFSCNSLNINNCSDISCVDACTNSNFTNSDVYCELNSACSNSTFENSTVACSQAQACTGAKFFNSAVECQLSGVDSDIPCDGALWFQCTCCLSLDPSACPTEIPSCFDDDPFAENPFTTNDFCKKKFLGKTCKDWGNPLCANNEFSARQCSPSDDIVDCGLHQSCINITSFEACTVNCVNADDCYWILFDQSTVACQAPYSCELSNFVNSEVTCIQDNSCAYSLHFRSTVNCKESESCNSSAFVISGVDCLENGSCSNTYWTPCSCCMSADTCHIDAVPCYDSTSGSPDNFCNTTFLGRTCKDWGNPLCASSDVASVEPLHPASTCSENVDMVECLGDCYSFESPLSINSCSAFCVGDCFGFSFENSTAFCFGLCDNATFTGSEVECSANGCWDTMFTSSAVNCSGTGTCARAQFQSSAVNCSSADSCVDAELDGCSCCTVRDNCPDGGELCFDSQTVSIFCNKTQNDPKCQTAPNPICKDTVPTAPPKATKPPRASKEGPTASKESNDTSKELYALSALAVIPLAIATIFIRKRYFHKSSGSVEPRNSSPDLPQAIHTIDSTPFRNLPEASQTVCVSAVLLEDSTNEGDKGRTQLSKERYQLSNKDQCRTHIGEISGPSLNAHPASYEIAQL